MKHNEPRPSKNMEGFLNRPEHKDFGKRFARGLYGNFTDSKQKRKETFHRVKGLLDFPDLCQAADYLSKNLPEHFREPLFGNPLPKSYEDLGNCEVQYPAENFISEINWTLISIRKYHVKISLFLAYKELYEASFILGEYGKAEKYLRKIEEEICYSLWSLENRFLLKEFTDSSAESKDLLSDFNKSNKSKAVTKTLAHFLSIRAEKELTVNRYNSDLGSILNRLPEDWKSEHKNFYLFKLSYLNNVQFSNFIEIIAFDFPHSIIDRYLTLRKVLTSLFTTANQMIEKVEIGKYIKSYIVNRINYIARKISDPVLFKLKLFSGEKIFPAFSLSESRKHVRVIDKYTTGLYQEVEEDLREYLLESPLQFDLYELFVKTIVYQKKSFLPIGNPTSLLNQILLGMYNIISIKSDPKIIGANLLRISNNLSSCILSYGILDFVQSKTQGKNERQLLARLSYNAANPILHEIFREQEKQVEYLEMLKKRFPESVSVEFLLEKTKGVDGIMVFQSRLPEVKFKSELAKSLQRKHEFGQSIAIWKQLISRNIDNIPVLEISIKNLYYCLEKTEQFDDCIQLFVESFFINPYIIEKIETATLLNRIKVKRFRIVKPTIDLPIFYTITNADENEIHISYERFNLHFGVFRPKDLLEHFDKFRKDKIVFYLKYTCGLEILKHSTHILGSKERLEERLAICQFLKEKDNESKESYDEEIKYISNILVIQKGLLQLDESKIYVNEQGIISKELKDYEPIFHRFKTIATIAEKSKISFLDMRGRLTSFKYAEEKSTDKIEYSINPVYDIYVELFEAIKNKFLHSKFGIVAYLSTRIRHGVLLGEIRPIFEKHKLITQKEGESGTYRKNYYWETMFRDESPVTQARIQSLLRDFSINIDGMIFDLIKKYLQVYDINSNKDGWFNYEFKDEELLWYSAKALETKDFHHFATQVIDILWEKTDANLKIIREKIQKDIAQLFNEQFDMLEREAIELLGTTFSQPLVDGIKACSTETFNIIVKISSWFKRSGTSASDIRLANLIEIVVGVTNKSNPNKQVRLRKEINCDCKIRGAYLTHFADLLRIFIENILKHSDDKVDSVQGMIKTELHSHHLVIIIENEITKKESLIALKSVKENEELDATRLLGEGKSGFIKALKILKSDLQNESNTLLTIVNEEETLFSVQMEINTKDLIL